ncbi:unnamed protein product [Lymnaea stagnalis]|uniref:Methyltransferase HEMK2 n=1 Tax=Lymnaea stagnalis TaxID=6523 RepID=A0AAV2HX02_LYMST
MSINSASKFSTPVIGNRNSEDFDHVYEPAEDSFLLLDALENEHFYLQELMPSICLEVGCGSGICITFLSQILEKSALFFCTDVNPLAAEMAFHTGCKNGQNIHPIVCDLANGVESRLEGNVDVLIFNPPYVVTPSEEVATKGISASWAGGIRGREVVDRFLPKINKLLSPKGVFYLVGIEENDPADIEKYMSRQGFQMTMVGKRRAGREHLFVLKFTRIKKSGRCQ